MPDNLTPENRRRTMQSVKGKATGLERQLASMLAGMKIRGWKKNVRDLIGIPDIVFGAEHIVIFIDGCFWHGCPYCKRKMPETNKEYWKNKIMRNIERADMQNRALNKDGWVVLRFWEHELRNPDLRKEIRAKIRGELEKVNANKQ